MVIEIPPGHVLVHVAELAALEGVIADTRCRIQTLLSRAYTDRNHATWQQAHVAGATTNVRVLAGG